eukprot:g12155.t1
MDQPDTPEHCTGLGESSTQASEIIQTHREPSGVAGSDTPKPTQSKPVEVLPRSPSPAPVPQDTAMQPFGAMLAPVLLELCAGQLSNLNWFRTDWQRGGALTGYATWSDADGEHSVVVKFPVPPKERRWLVQLSSDDVTPRIFAHGSELGGYDLAWVVMERLPHGPIGKAWGAKGYDLLAEAAANFYARAQLIPMGDPPPPRDWVGLLKQAKQSISKDTIEDSQRWRKLLKKVNKKLPDWLDTWNQRDTGFWCHGDLHPGNAMSRTPAPGNPQGIEDRGYAANPSGGAVLIDLACVHPGHWVEDAVYLEHLYWASPNALHGAKPVKLIAQHLRDYGLTPGHNWPELANIYRALLAMTAPYQRRANTGSAHTAASLKGAAEVVAGVVEAAEALLATLSEEQRGQISYGFDDAAQRERWSNLPSNRAKRGGLKMGDLTRPQQDAVYDLISATLSERGFQEVFDVVHSDAERHERGEKRPNFGRDYFYIALLGKPSTTEPWSWMFGGHHLGVNATIAGERITLSPTLTGGQPTHYHSGDRKVELQANEITAAHAMLAGLDDAKRAKAVVSDRRGNLAFGPGTKEVVPKTEGVRGDALNEAQQKLLLALIEERVGLLNDTHAALAMQRISDTIDQTYFAWFGPTDKAEPAMWRIQGPAVIIEFCPQNLGGDPHNHIHAMYREPGNDFAKQSVKAPKDE